MTKHFISYDMSSHIIMAVEMMIALGVFIPIQLTSLT